MPASDEFTAWRGVFIGVIAHVGGAPVEELLLPFLTTGGTMLLVAVRLAFVRVKARRSGER